MAAPMTYAAMPQQAMPQTVQYAGAPQMVTGGMQVMEAVPQGMTVMQAAPQMMQAPLMQAPPQVTYAQPEQVVVQQPQMYAQAPMMEQFVTQQPMQGQPQQLPPMMAKVL